jgi:phage FluMu gp28-like protein
MAKAVPFVRKTVLLEEEKVQQLMKELKATDESAAIRTAINDRLFADAVMKHVKRIQCRGTIQDAYQRATRK